MQHYKWYCGRCKGDTVALGPIQAINKEEARYFFRDLLNVNKLPNGFEIWREYKPIGQTFSD